MLRLFILFAFASAMFAAQLKAQAPQWSQGDAEQLLSLLSEIKDEGLDPADYDRTDFRSALASGNPEMLNQSATAVFMHLVADLSQGHVKDRSRLAWYIKGPVLDEPARQSLLQSALSRHQVKQVLTSLLPINPEYQRLRDALKATPASDRAALQRLRANLDRWRWMPRFLGRRYIVVNVPAFELTLIEDGNTIARHKIIVGKTGTPTPQFSATVQAVQFNPSWYVPQSIVAESVGKLVRTQPEAARQRGYVTSKSGIRQRPGPDNALGQMKLVMPNPYTVYIHDTPTKALFDEQVRAFSHGCIRTQDALDFAAKLLGSPAWNKVAIERVTQSRVTTDVPLDVPIPVYVTYFTAATDENGEIASYPDLYGRDGAVIASLIDREPPDPRLAAAAR